MLCTMFMYYDRPVAITNCLPSGAIALVDPFKAAECEILTTCSALCI